MNRDERIFAEIMDRWLGKTLMKFSATCKTQEEINWLNRLIEFINNEFKLLGIEGILNDEDNGNQ